MSEPFIGQISLFGFNFAPRGWAFCAGQLLAISSNSALFSLLGNLYGGDGRTTFGLPDFRGRVSVGFGQGPGLGNYRLGSKGGAERFTQTVQTLANHNHGLSDATGTGTLRGVSEAGDAASPAGNYMASLDEAYRASGTPVDMNAGSLAVSLTGGTVGNTGGSQTISLLQPYQVINYSIALLGIFPSRS